MGATFSQNNLLVGEQVDDSRTTPGRNASDNRSTPSAQLGAPRPAAADREAEIKKQRAEYLAQILRERTARSPIDDLPPERQQTLFELLEENPATIVVEMIAEPEPLGWNFTIGVSSLKRFHKRCHRQMEQAERLRAIAENTKIIQELGPSNAKAVEAAQNLIKIRFVDTAREPSSSNHDLQILSRIIDRQRRTDLAERKQQFTERQATDK